MKYNLRMTKQFVKYEVAVELKKLGFAEPCLGRWLVVTKWEKRTGEIILQLGSRAEDFDKNQFLAPTFSQAFRFFREKYKLHSKIEIQDVELDWYFYEILDVKNGRYNNDKHEDMNFKSYEEAEIACLRKLIEIVKNK